MFGQLSNRDRLRDLLFVQILIKLNTIIRAWKIILCQTPLQGLIKQDASRCLTPNENSKTAA